jgi:large repetitive protein
VKQKHNYTKTTLCILILLCISIFSLGQSKSQSISNLKETFNASNSFIENIGQYGQTMKGHEQMGNIQYGYEGFGMPILFTPKGLIHLQRKIEKLSHKEEEELEKGGAKEEAIEQKKNITDRTITMEWVGANSTVEIIKEERTTDYHTYGMLIQKAFGYKKITYKNIYDGIDVVYSFANNPQDVVHSKLGFEYILIVQPGADLSKVKMKYGGDIKSITTNSKGNLIIKSDIDGIEETIPVSYYGNKIIEKNYSEIKTEYKINGNEIIFSLPQGYDNTKALIIDPFINNTNSLTGTSAGIAKDVDFDYAGNVYVVGGGDVIGVHKLAKYNAVGILQWTFTGTLTLPVWGFGPYYGGNVVEKSTGNTYLGQGFNFTEGFRVIRVNTFGLYDNYITNGNKSFRENWKMIWNCNSGSPQIFVAGGGTNSNINLGIVTPPTLNPISANLTGLPTAYQDMVDMVIDPTTNNMYTLYAAGLNPEITNNILKHNPPYNAGTIVWNQPSGFAVVQEAANRPYLGAGLQDNSMNCMAINANYLFYWDGRNLKAISKATGATVGTPITLGANVAKMQGGIVVDACNNVFIGSTNGTIKVYNFDGTIFNDAPADISVTGYGAANVYDLALDESKKLLYASGKGFVASFDVSTYCINTIYNLNITSNCGTGTANVVVTPTPPAGSTISYSLYNGTILLATNTTGNFTGLLPNINYTVIATINFACSGIQVSGNFTIVAPVINTSITNTTCGTSNGQIIVTGTGGTGPYTYSLNGAAFQGNGTFSNLAAGNYNVAIQDATGCKNNITVTVLNTDGPTLTYTNTNATCGASAGSITASATGGTAPYLYSINNGTTYQGSNFFTALPPGIYNLVVKDATNCTNATTVTITSGPKPIIFATPGTATCGLNNGSITAFGNVGTAPYQYSIDGNNFQATNLFSNLIPGTYTVYVKDAIGCTATTIVTVANNPLPTLTATSTSAACGNANGTITINATGTPTLMYSLNNGSFQFNNFFIGLVSGSYTITVKDNYNCTSFINVVVSSTNGPSITATTTASSCATNNGTITATVTGATGAVQYSINGFTTVQFTNVFTGLAAGTYTVLIKDGNGCITGTTVIVGTLTPPGLSLNITPSPCGSNNGIITITGSGAGPYTYSIDGTTFQGSNVFNGLAPNTYTVTIKDANGCTSTFIAVVTNVANLSLTAGTIISSCASNTGVITAVANGGTAPLNYSIDGATYVPSNVFNNLPAGTYTLYVKDATGCIVTKQIIVESLIGPSLSVSVPLNATCASNNAVIIATGSGILPLTYSINGSTYQNTGTFINVAPNTYTVYVKDANGCIATQSVNVLTNGPGPGITDFTVVVKPYFPCDGDIGGKITNPKVNGATCGNCTYVLDFTTVATNPTQLFLDVPQGIHYVTATDINGCTMTIQVNMTIATNATATYTVVGSPCNATSGSITLTGVGLNQPYHSFVVGVSSSWITYDPSTTITGLAPGVYTIYSADDASFTTPPDVPGGCLDTIIVIVPVIGASPTITATPTNGTCGKTGTITAVGSLGTGPYTYNINGGIYQVSGIFNNLANGLYTVSVKDATGCVKTTTVTILNTTAPTITATSLGTSCGIANGSITLNATNGTAPYTYSIDAINFQASNAFTGLANDTYYLTVKDANDCKTNITVVISSITKPLVVAYSISANCGVSNGTIVATGSFGSAPYTYSVDGTVFQSSNTFSNLAAGFYTITVKDDRGCTSTTTITINNIGGPSFTQVISPATCGNSNGSISITATGGTPSYSYSNDGGLNFSTNAIFSNLLSGTYLLAIKDANNCIVTKSVFVGASLGPQTLTATVANASCGLPNGSVTLTATGGTLPYQYSKDGITYQLGSTLTGLTANTYTVYVRDANLCPKSIPVTIINLPAPTITAIATPAFCGFNDGTITATATGGTLALSYSKDGITFQPSNIFTGLAGGPYTITVRDAKTCTNTTFVTVIAPTLTTPTFNTVAPICSGAVLNALPTTSLNNINGAWSPALNNTANGTYTFTPTAGQCATTQTMAIVVNPILSPTINCGVSNTNAVNFTWANVGTASGYNVSYQVNANAPVIIGAIGNTLNYTVNGLSGGDNVVITVTPTGSGCYTLATKSCTAAPCSPATATVSYGTPFCSNITIPQAVTLNGTGVFTGGTYSGTAGLTVNATTGEIVPSTSTTGNHTVTYTIAAAGGCSQVIATAPVTINPKPLPTILSSLGTTLQVGQITTFSTSIPYGTYQWYNSGVLIQGATNPTYDVGVQGNYAVEVTNANGCIGISEYFTLVVLDGTTYVTNGHKQQDDNHFLQWHNTGTTAAPLSIEMSIDGIHFTTIALIDNLNQLQYTAQQIFTDPIYYYRLKWKNNINLTRYSNTIIIYGKKLGVQLLLYPNPTEGVYNISSNKLIQQVIVLNTIGETIFKDPIAAYQKYYNASALANGNYIIKVLIDGKWNILPLMKQ